MIHHQITHQNYFKVKLLDNRLPLKYMNCENSIEYRKDLGEYMKM